MDSKLSAHWRNKIAETRTTFSRPLFALKQNTEMLMKKMVKLKFAIVKVKFLQQFLTWYNDVRPTCVCWFRQDFSHFHILEGLSIMKAWCWTIFTRCIHKLFLKFIN